MYCLKCGMNHPNGTRYCSRCGAALSAPTGASPAAAEKKTSKMDFSLLVVAVIFVVLSIINIRDMQAGEMYMAFFGEIPIQYLLLPGAAVSLILWIRENASDARA